jgi:O-antigen ligase
VRLVLLQGPGKHREDLAALFAVGMGLLVFLRSDAGMSGWTATMLAIGGLICALIGALVSPKSGLAGVVAALPFFLFPRQLGGQSFALHEVMLFLTLAAVVVRTATTRLLGNRVVVVPRGPGQKLTARDAMGSVQAGEIPLAPAGEGGWGGEGWRLFDLPIALFLVAALLSLLATEYLRLSLRELRTLIVEPVLFWYLCRAVLRTRSDVAWLVGALLASTTIVAMIGLVQLVIGGAVTDVQGVRRVQGPYSSPNHLALLLGRALPFMLAGAWLLPRFRVILVGMGLLCAGALAATFSLGGWAGTGAAILVVVGLLGGRRWLLALVLAGAILGGIVLFAAPTERLSRRFDLTQGTSLVRIQLWQASIGLIEQSPLLGIGMDNFLYRYPPLLPDDTTFEPNLSHPHNLLLQSWLELGLLGLAAMLWLLGTFARLAWQQAREASGPTDGLPLGRALAVGALGSMTDFVVHGLVDNSYFLPDMAVIFWLTLAVAAVAAIPASMTAQASTVTPG